MSDIPNVKYLTLDTDNRPELLHDGQRLCGASTKRAAVEFALQELVRRRDRRKVLDLQGRVEWVGDLGKSRRSV